MNTFAAIRSRALSFGAWVYERPGGFFIVMSLIFGCALIFRLAPLNGTDEFTHFPRAYQISQGVWWEQRLKDDPANGWQYGGRLPSHVADMINDYRDLSRKSDYDAYERQKTELSVRYGRQRDPGRQTTESNFTSVAVYPPWAYVPDALGILVARVSQAPLTWYVYAARLVSLLVYIGLVFAAIKLLPGGKWFMAAVALLPTSLTQALTVGADGLLNGASWVLVAAVLYAYGAREPLSAAISSVIVAATTAVSAIKIAYWPLAAFPLILTDTAFKNRTRARAFKAGIGLVIATLGGWLALHTRSIGAHTVLTPREGQYINSHDQLQNVLHHPFSFVIRALTQPFSKDYDAVYQGLVGVVTSRTLYLSLMVMAMLYVGLLIALIDAKKIERLRANRRRLLVGGLLIAVLTQLLLSLTFYLANTQVGAAGIFGVYGRYFLPVLPMALMIPLTCAMPYRLKRPVLALSLCTIICVSLVSTVWAVG